MKKKDNLPGSGEAPRKEPVAGTTGESTAYPPEKIKGELLPAKTESGGKKKN